MVVLAQATEFTAPVEAEEPDDSTEDDEEEAPQAQPRPQPPPRQAAERPAPPKRPPEGASARQPRRVPAPAEASSPPADASPQPPPKQGSSPQPPATSSQARPPDPPPRQPSSQPPCPPAQPPPTSAPDGTISGTNICGATIVGGTIVGAKIVGSTISGGSISGGAISGGKISGGNISGGNISRSDIAASDGAPPQTPPGNPPPNAPAAPPSAAAGGDHPAQAQGQSAPPNSSPQARSGPRNRDSRTAATPRSRPGQKRDPGASDDEDDEDEADLAARALERALVQRGALLLPIWGFELTPAFTYGHTSQDTFAAIAGSSGPPTTVGIRKRTHQLTGSLTARLGLPLDLQIEAAIPASLALSNVTIAGAASSDTSGFGIGDPRVALTWQMIHAGDVAPDVFLAASFKPKLGSSPYDAGPGDVGLGTGYAAVGGTITAVKSADPLVLLANVSYTANLATNTRQGRRDPGNTYGLGGGAILAVSPDTSLSFLLDFHYRPDDTLDGKSLVGSDETFAVLQIGLGRVVSRSVLFNVTAGIGLTADSPNFQLGVSMPLRF